MVEYFWIASPTCASPRRGQHRISGATTVETHRWSVHDGKGLFQIPEAERVEEDDVLVAQGGEEGVLGERRRSLLHLVVCPLALLVERVDLVPAMRSPECELCSRGCRLVKPLRAEVETKQNARQQARQAKRFSLLHTEPSTLVQRGFIQKGASAQGSPDGSLRMRR